MYERHTTTRYFLRTQKPSIGFFPWGLLGLLLILLPLLYGLLFFAKNSIQANVRTELQKELALNDLDWVNIDVNGQHVSLSGTGSLQAGDMAIALAKKVKGATVFGFLTAPVYVEGEFSSAKPVVKAKPTIKTIEKVKAVLSPPKQVWGKLEATLKSGVLTLVGTVGSKEERADLVSSVRQQMHQLKPPRFTKVIDQLTVSTKPLLPGSATLAKRASFLIASCKHGQAQSINGVFSINCQTQRSQTTNLKAAASAPLSQGRLGKIFVSASDDCNESFAKTLDGKSIGFAISSANLKASSSSLLNQIATLAKTCPGTIRVEGHTDKTGSLDANMTLSDARARAVVHALVARGVKKDRLIPKGFGPTKPRAKDNTQEAYAYNRRIEFYVSD